MTEFFKCFSVELCYTTIYIKYKINEKQALFLSFTLFLKQSFHMQCIAMYCMKILLVCGVFNYTNFQNVAFRIHCTLLRTIETVMFSTQISFRGFVSNINDSSRVSILIQYFAIQCFFYETDYIWVPQCQGASGFPVEGTTKIYKLCMLIQHMLIW